jgi:hypothetical protein
LIEVSMTLLLALLIGHGALLEEARGGEFRPPPEQVLKRSKELFEETLRSSDPARLADQWRRIGFELSSEAGGAGVWSLRESPDRREGRGFYLFRSGPAAPVAIQAPHGVEQDDMLTGDIALALFERHAGKAGAWSTVPRESVDLAHSTQTVFHQFTRAFAGVFGREALVVQIHGYRRDRRESPEGRASAAILSLGTREASPALERAASCLGRALDSPVGFFPNVPELGALTNEQGRLLRAVGGPTFLHVELSYPLRERLVGQVEDLDRLGTCLLEVGP